jgi:hypothetical protein
LRDAAIEIPPNTVNLVGCDDVDKGYQQRLATPSRLWYEFVEVRTNVTRLLNPIAGAERGILKTGLSNAKSTYLRG